MERPEGSCGNRSNNNGNNIHSRAYDDPDVENVTPNITKSNTSSTTSNLLLEIQPFEFIDSVEPSGQAELLMKHKSEHKSLRVDDSDKIKEKRCEYARNQMRKYRLKIKSDPARYAEYLEKERMRSLKRREQKILELTNIGKTLEEARKILKLRNLRGEMKLKNQNSEIKIKHVKAKECNVLGRIDSNIQQTKQTKQSSNIKSTDIMIKNDVKEEPDEWLEDEELQEEEIKYNRICGVVTCPSRLNQFLAVQYYPIPTEKTIRDVWFKLIKSKTKQSEIDPDSFICSLHFAPEWFEIDEIYGEERLLPIAVPTLFPESQIYSQFDAKIPVIFDKDLYNSKLFKNYYEWSFAKIRQYESQLKEQLLIIENLNESKEIQNKRMDRLIKATRDYKFNTTCNNKKRYLQIIFDQIQDIEDYSTHR